MHSFYPFLAHQFCYLWRFIIRVGRLEPPTDGVLMKFSSANRDIIQIQVVFLFFSVLLFEHFSRFVGGCPSQRPNECWQTVRVGGRDQRFFRGRQSGSVGTPRSASDDYWCDQFARLKAAVHGPSLEPLECIIFVCVAETKNGTVAFYLLCCSRIQLLMTPHLWLVHNVRRISNFTFSLLIQCCFSVNSCLCFGIWWIS